VTKATLRSLTQRIAHGLRAHFDIGARGPNTDIVTVISGGQVLVPAAFFGIIAAGGVYSAASPSSTPAELARQVRIGTSRLVIADRAHAGVAREAAAQCGLDADRVVLVLDSSPGRWSLKSVDRSMDALSDQTLEWERRPREARPR
jgi:acyl-CoA synthetase (AMP-forming)/AMP-acid ligase II